MPRETEQDFLFQDPGFNRMLGKSANLLPTRIYRKLGETESLHYNKYILKFNKVSHNIKPILSQSLRLKTHFSRRFWSTKVIMKGWERKKGKQKCKAHL